MIDEGARIVNPCVKSVLIKVNQPEKIGCEIVKGFGDYIYCDGNPNDIYNYLTAQVPEDLDGTYTYEWEVNESAMLNGWYISSDPNQSTINFVPGLVGAMFTVTITDEDGCQTSCNIKAYAKCKNSPQYNGNVRLTSNLDANLFPNPVRDKLNIKFNQEIASNVQVKIYNLIGTTVISKRFDTIDNSEVILDMNGLPSQVYYVKIITDKGTLIKKVILDK